MYLILAIPLFSIVLTQIWYGYQKYPIASLIKTSLTFCSLVSILTLSCLYLFG